MEKVLFYSKMQHPKLVMETKKTFKSDGEACQGKVIQFDRHHFETSDTEMIEYIRKHPLFGHEYQEVNSRKNEPAPVGKPTVAGMDEQEEQKLKAFRDDILGQVDAKLNAVVDTISKLLPAETPETTEKKEDTKKDDTTPVSKTKSKSEASQKK